MKTFLTADKIDSKKLNAYSLSRFYSFFINEKVQFDQFSNY